MASTNECFSSPGGWAAALGPWVARGSLGSRDRRLQNATRELRLVLTQILALADELAADTIERQLSKSDAELGLEHLLRSHPPR